MTHDEEAAPGARVRWTSLVLHFADGSGLLSVWDAARACALQRDGTRTMSKVDATGEHLRALAELQETGGTTNWLVSTSATALHSPPLEAIDWSGFEAPDPDQ